jgi:hypothetical protein
MLTAPAQQTCAGAGPPVASLSTEGLTMRYSAPHRAQETSGEFNGEDRQYPVV